MYPNKSELRLRLRTLLKENSSLAEQKSARICQTIRQHAWWLDASTIALFAPLPEEPDLRPLCPTATKRLLFPKISGAELVWIEVQNPSRELSPCPEGKTRLQEPRQGQIVELSEIELLLIPGLGFSKSGLRLGRGGGYYDRVLSAKSSNTKVIGVCFNYQLQDFIPVETHDQPVDAVVFD